MKQLYQMLSLFVLILSVNQLNANVITNYYKDEISELYAPTATITASANSVCQNAANPVITFTGSGGTAPYSFTYKINGGTAQTITTLNGNSINVDVSTLVSGSFIYTLENVSDFSNTSVSILGQLQTINVNAVPIVDFTFIDNQCSGTTVQFNTTSIGDSYTWNFGDLTTSTQKNPSHIFNSFGCSTKTFSVTLTVTNSNGCSTTVTKIITIKQKPDINFEDSNATGAGNQFNNCANASSNSSYTVKVGNLSTSVCIASYSIKWGDSTADELNASFPISHTYSSIGVFNMIITALGTNGCISTKTYVVKNVSNPLGGLNSPGSTQNICSPTTNLEFSISNWGTNSPDTTYKVDYGDNTGQTIWTQSQLEASSFYDATNPSASGNFPIPHTYTSSSCPLPSFTVKLDVTNACGTTPFTLANVSVLSKPLANFNAPLNACLNSSVTFNNTTIQGSDTGCIGTTKYTWNFGDPSSGGSNIITTGFVDTIPNVNHTFSSPGTYTVTLSAQNSCGTTTKTQQICIESPLVPQFNLNSSSGCAPTSIITTNTTVEANQCSPPTYLWSVTYASGNCGTSITPIAEQTTKNATYNFTVPGTYTITLTATNSCGSVSTSQTVTVKQPPTISAINGILPNYCGPTTLNPTATVALCTPLTGTLAYAWSFPGGTPSAASTSVPGTISYATAGTYTVSLVVTNECGDSAPFTKIFTVSDVPSITTTPLAQTICSGTATSAVNLIANLPNTTYSWTATSTAGITGFTTSGTTNIIPSQTIVNTSPTTGTVTYVITPSLNGCNRTAVNYVIKVNPGPNIITQPASSTLCLSGTPAVLSVALNNTSGGPTYQWYSNTVNNAATGTIISGETNPTYSPVASAIGTTYYYCIITLTSGGCSSLTSAVASVTVVNSTIITTQPLGSQNLCVGVTINNPLSVSYSGGTGTPSYQWFINTTNSNTGGTSISGATNSTYTPPVFTLANSYFYYVTIALSGTSCGNLSSAVAEIIVDNDPTIATQPILSQTVCQNATPTDLNVTLSGGSGTYSYQWYGNLANNTTGGTIIIGATSSIYSPLTTTVGTKYYYCIITQNGVAGCAVTSATALVTTAATPFFTTQPVSSTICLGQSTPVLIVAYTNGTGTAQYQWYSNTSNSNVGGISITSGTGATFQPLSAVIGTNYYYCIVTFPSLAAGCGVIASNIAQITISPKATISSEITTICSGATFKIEPVNTAGNIVPTGTTYTWSNPTISPSGSVTGASASAIGQANIIQTLINTTTSTATVVYTVIPTTGSCIGNPFTITVTVNPATNPNAVKTDSTCFGINNGSITTNSTGGIPFSTGSPYSFSWSGPNGFTSSDPSISSLAPGLYTLSISDAGGCPVVNTYTVNEPAPISITTDSTINISCFGNANGSIAITAQGGVGNYSYTWTKDGNPYAGADDIANLSKGTYDVSVSDANNCFPATAIFLITEPPILSVSLVNQTNIGCYGASTGAITIIVSGGTIASDYNYLWSGPNGFASFNQNLNNLSAGTYNLTVMDDLGCSKILSVTLTQSAEIIINAITTPIVCYGDDNATIAVTLSGGNAPYQVQWSNLAVGLNQNNLAPGDYTITVTDNLGCAKSKVINIPSPPVFTVNPLVTQISCFGANDGSIRLNLVGGKPTVKLVWSDGSLSGTTRNNLKPGTYSVSIIDGTPCQITRTFIIVEPQLLVLDANVTNALDCNNANSGAINLLVSGGTAPFSYAWSNGSVTEDLAAIAAGNYLVTVTDARNCSVTASYSIVRPSPIVIKVETVTDFNCATKVVKQSFIAKVSGGIPPYQYVWSSGTISGADHEIMNTSQNGLVVLDAIDARGCKSSYTFNVAIPELGTPSFATTSLGFNTYGFYSIEDPIQFTNTATGDFTNIGWDFGDGTFSNDLNPVHIYKKEGAYVVRQIVTYPFGCVYVSTITLLLEKGYRLIPPTAFTPNGDGVNDYFSPEFLGLNQIRFDVYDTWGSLIYSESGDSIRGWDGKINNKEAENGNYYFKITGKTFYGKIIKDQGPVVLIK